jgi:hypothetical protein
MVNDLFEELIRYGAEKFLSPRVAAVIFGKDARYYAQEDDRSDPARDAALKEVKRKDGSVSLWIGTRETGKSVGSQRQAEYFGRPTYTVSPEEKPPSWITRVTLNDLDKLPHFITLIMEDLPAYMSNRDYNNTLIINVERIVPMCRHERKWHLIFNTQSSVQADRYILDCELAFMKPWGILMEDAERPGIRRIYKKLVMPYFEGKSEDFIRKHAFMKSRTYVGGISIAKPASHKELVLLAEPNVSGVYEVTGTEEVDAKE